MAMKPKKGGRKGTIEIGSQGTQVLLEFIGGVPSHFQISPKLARAMAKDLMDSADDADKTKLKQESN